jgi:hypothetical protein
MATRAANKTIEFLRIGNPWLVGKNVSRVVPIYLVHNLVAPDFESDKAIQAIKHLAFDAKRGIDDGLASRVAVQEQDYHDLQISVFGLLSPERRIFADKKRGGAGSFGALYPLVAGLVSATSSDDGLGRRVRALMELHRTNWQDRLIELFLPSKAKDPATGFAMALLGGVAGHKIVAERPASKEKLTGFDLDVAEFIDRLIVAETGARRIAVIRDLTLGSYAMAIMRMVSGPIVERTNEVPMVFVYGGLPPGRQSDPLVRAACKSFQKWIASSWVETVSLAQQEIKSAKANSRSTPADRLRQKLKNALSNRTHAKERDIEAVIEGLKSSIDRKQFSDTWCREVSESKSVDFRKQELARRVRSLGANVGLTGPDRGTGSPRLVIDTPLLGVLVKGMLAVGESMKFEQFVSELARRFGLVLGLGEDDEIAERLEFIGSSGFDAYELLVQNQELLRERLLRAGLARSYSDSHTEIVNG